MGLSLANTMSPFMGRGAPMVVIKGGFALGLVRREQQPYSLFIASLIKITGLATSTAGFSFEIKGRDGLSDYASNGGITSIDAPTFFSITSETASADYPMGGSASAAEAAAHLAHPRLGTVVADDVRIILHGKLDSLRPSYLCAGGRYNNQFSTDRWTGVYYHRWPDGSYNGWYTSEVHIFDNPQLQITGRTAFSTGTKVFWDC